MEWPYLDIAVFYIEWSQVPEGGCRKLICYARVEGGVVLRGGVDRQLVSPHLQHLDEG